FRGRVGRRLHAHGRAGQDHRQPRSAARTRPVLYRLQPVARRSRLRRGAYREGRRPAPGGAAAPDPRPARSRLARRPDVPGHAAQDRRLPRCRSGRQGRGALRRAAPYAAVSRPLRRPDLGALPAPARLPP
ncbi:hypothetical protein LTR94_034061, partial [Friedmanniomyces endolithicus]